MKQIQISIVLFLIFTGCFSQTHTSVQPDFDTIQKVNFCDLPKHEGELVLIEGTYSGVDEYWAINALKKCKKIDNVELDYYKDGNPIPQKFRSLFDTTYFSYWNTYLIIKATGRYDSKDKDGYGHLGSNKSRSSFRSLSM